MRTILLVLGLAGGFGCRGPQPAAGAGRETSGATAKPDAKRAEAEGAPKDPARDPAIRIAIELRPEEAAAPGPPEAARRPLTEAERKLAMELLQREVGALRGVALERRRPDFELAVAAYAVRPPATGIEEFLLLARVRVPDEEAERKAFAEGARLPGTPPGAWHLQFVEGSGADLTAAAKRFAAALDQAVLQRWRLELKKLSRAK